MLYLYDVMLCMDKEKRIVQIRWKNQALQNFCQTYWNTYLHKCPEEIADFELDKEHSLLYWKKKRFHFQEEYWTDQSSFWLLKQQDDTLLLYQKALHLLDEGIQIYDKNANIVYFNDTSKQIVGIDEESFQGKNLLEVFDVSAEESSTIEALRLNAPVRNRFNHYYSKKGKELITINTTLPLRDEGELIGALTLEENVSVVQKRSERLKHLQSIIEEKLSDGAFFHSSDVHTFDDFIGGNHQMRTLKERAQKLAPDSNHLFIFGETGTGKSLLAQAIHQASSRKEHPFISLNCSAVPESLMEIILFGTEKEVFTGSADRLGLLEEADNGTLFLSEIDYLSFSAQTRLLSFLQKGTFRRAGGYKKRSSHVRIIVSCAKDPFLLTEQQRLHYDLFCQLSTAILEVPPLRNHMEDMEELILYRIQEKKNRYAFPFTRMDPSVLLQLQQYSWPGNVRELFLAVDYAMNVAEDSVFRMEYLPPYCFQEIKKNAQTVSDFPPLSEDTLQVQMERYEKKILQDTLIYYRGNITRAAKALGMQRQSLQYRIRKYGITLM